MTDNLRKHEKMDAYVAHGTRGRSEKPIGIASGADVVIDAIYLCV